ncbi:peptide-methionine (S)-S-oxide reductase MsrA [Loktanella sp. S4079]|uniref:peptide-methionine (S)-S-oxide reductase MsrA n=1 Tax=Loktanella sp. S4079 TaxID=579483 RepID=UPI0005F9BCB2|nr:peptide-methionine (S)-S-oxide reductase MsrA [Loktanella sp. S4079]KJZ18283.1 methionine sulfoxide reductase A [Loktanella sp. S4079]
MFRLNADKTQMVDAQNALPGRQTAMPVPQAHSVFGTPLAVDVPAGMQVAIFGMGCFWGVERIFWQIDGVVSTMVGYAGGFTPNPTYEEVCTGKTGHNEVVRVVFDPTRVSYTRLLQMFWENHDPTQGMRQGNDMGTQYRSGIYVADAEQKTAAETSKQEFAPRLASAGYGQITTEIIDAPAFYYAEEYHQQYLAKNPDGYCGIGGTGVTCPIGLAT